MGASCCCQLPVKAGMLSAWHPVLRVVGSRKSWGHAGMQTLRLPISQAWGEVQQQQA